MKSMVTVKKNFKLDPTQVGPFGGQGGSAWDDGTYSVIREIIIYYNYDVIKSIQIQYDKNGRPVMGPQHGDSSTSDMDVVKLDYPGEFIVYMTGYLTEDSSHVRSLSFRTNIQWYGPYGKNHGLYFTTSKTKGKIVGFFGRSDLDLNAIGTYIQPSPGPYYPCTNQPYGGNGGSAWDDGIYTGVRQLVINAGDDTIDSFLVEYDNDGLPVYDTKDHGDPTRGELNEVVLDYPNEFMIGLRGSYSYEYGNTLIRSLTIETNKKTYGPYGVERGTTFEFPSESGIIIGFLGRAGLAIDAIGVHYSPFPQLPAPSSCGPCGGTGGTSWNDGCYTTIRTINIWSSDKINSIQIVYDNRGRPVSSDQHGSNTASSKLNSVFLDFPNEYVISIYGYYENVNGSTVVRSLKIETNKDMYGPFGVEHGTSFKFPPTDGRINGIFGRAGYYLDAIGAYYLPFPA